MKPVTNFFQSELYRSLARKSREERSKIISRFVSNGNLSRDDLLHEASFLDSNFNKSILATAWLNKDERTLEDLQGVMTIFTNDWRKFDIAQTWLNKEGRNLGDLQDVLTIFTNNLIKSNITQTFLNKETNPETKYNNFVLLAKGAFCDLYDIQAITSMYLRSHLPADKIGNLCKDLYPTNEYLQTETFEQFMSIMPQRPLVEAKQNLTSFIKDLNSDDFAFQALNSLETKVQLEPLEVLEISKGRLSEKYQSILEYLNGRALSDSLTEEGMKTLNEKFGQIQEDIRVSDIFSYYDINQQLPLFTSILRSEIVAEIADNFFPSEKSVYVSRQEFDKLKGSIVPNLDLPEVRIIGDYLELQVAPKINTSPLNEERISSFKFANSESLGANLLLAKNSFEESKEDSPSQAAEESEKFTNEFKNLLREENPSPQNVASFFERALGLEEKIKENNKEKLTDFFKNNKQLLVLLFEKDAGLDNFALAIRSLGDGCVANIATQAKNATYQILLEDSTVDQALFGVFNEKISTPILNSGGDHLTGSATGINIFTDRFITQNYISPSVLAKALIEEFCKEGNKSIKSPGTLLYQELGDERTDDVTQHLIKTNPENINAKIAEIATYLILKKALPEILESKYLANFKSSVEGILDYQDISQNKDSSLREESKTPNISLEPNSSQSLQVIKSTRDRSKSIDMG